MRTVAPLKKRFSALLLDYLAILCYMAVMFGISMFIFLVILKGIPIFNEVGMNLVSLVLVVPVVVCSIIMESSKTHATLGKRKLKIKVASINEQPIRIWQIVLRNIIKFLPWQLAHMAIFRGFTFDWNLPPLWLAALIVTDVLPFVWIAFLFRKDHRGIHDLIAKTVVIDDGTGTIVSKTDINEALQPNQG